MQYDEVLDEFWGPFSQALKTAEEKMPAQAAQETGEKCPSAASRWSSNFSKKTGSEFVGCSGYQGRLQVHQARRGRGGTARAGETEHKCPTCGKPMLQTHGPAAASSWLQRLSRMQDDDELRRRRQAGAGGQADGAHLREVRQADGACARAGAGRSWPAPAIPSARTPRTWTPRAIRSSRSTLASTARSAARRWR